MAKKKDHFMLYVFESDEYPKDKPHVWAKVRCLNCGGKYVIVVPKPNEGEPFECPECHQVTRWQKARLKGEIKC